MVRSISDNITRLERSASRYKETAFFVLATAIVLDLVASIGTGWIFRVLAWLFGDPGDTNEFPTLKSNWLIWFLRASAIAYIAFIPLEKLGDNRDSKARALRDERDKENEKRHREEIDSLKRLMDEDAAPRDISEKQRQELLPKIVALGKHDFIVVQIGFGDREAAFYSLRISALLTEGRWTGITHTGVEAGDDTFRINAGVAVRAGPEDAMEFRKTGQPFWTPQRLEDAFYAAGIKMAGDTAMSQNPTIKIPKGTVLVLVGTRPDRANQDSTPVSAMKS